MKIKKYPILAKNKRLSGLYSPTLPIDSEISQISVQVRIAEYLRPFCNLEVLF